MAAGYAGLVKGKEVLELKTKEKESRRTVSVKPGNKGVLKVVCEVG